MFPFSFIIQKNYYLDNTSKKKQEKKQSFLMCTGLLKNFRGNFIVNDIFIFAKATLCLTIHTTKQNGSRIMFSYDL